MERIRTKIFQTWFRFSRPLTLGVRAAVEDQEGRVLLVRHTYVKGLFLPGGGVEKGETALTALTRELEEEGGIALTGAPEMIGIYSNHKSFANDHVILYRVGSANWTPCPATSRGEIAECLWVDPAAPPADLTPGSARRLKELYQGGAIDPYW